MMICRQSTLHLNNSFKAYGVIANTMITITDAEAGALTNRTRLYNPDPCILSLQ
jgi:hypothetical protein